MLERLNVLDSEYKQHHFAIIDQIDDDEELDREQEKLDQHDDHVAELTVSPKRLLSNHTGSSSMTTQQKVITRNLSHSRKLLVALWDSISTDPDTTVLYQHEDLHDHKKELSSIRNELLELDLPDENPSFVELIALEKLAHDCCLKTRSLINEHMSNLQAPTEGQSGVKLPKIEVPTFDRNVLHWKKFWEQFCVSVHGKSSLSDSEKLVYLQQALKYGSAKDTIEVCPDRVTVIQRPLNVYKQDMTSHVSSIRHMCVE